MAYICTDIDPTESTIFTKGKKYLEAFRERGGPAVIDNTGAVRVIGQDLKFIVENNSDPYTGKVDVRIAHFKKA